MTFFGILYDSVLKIQTDPGRATLTTHASPNRSVVEQRLQASILENVMQGEGSRSKASFCEI